MMAAVEGSSGWCNFPRAWADLALFLLRYLTGCSLKLFVKIFLQCDRLVIGIGRPSAIDCISSIEVKTTWLNKI